MSVAARALLMAGVFIMASLGWFGLSTETGPSFETVKARVSSVSMQCYLLEQGPYTAQKVPEGTAAENCTNLHDWLDAKPAPLRVKVLKTLHIAYEYVSPVDGETYQGTMAQRVGRNTYPFKNGDRIQVLASQETPSLSRVLHQL